MPSLSPVDAYVVLGAQQPPALAGEHPVRLLPRPEEDLGPHQAYAYQWWLFMPGGLVFIFFAMRRELAAGEADEADEADEAGETPEGTDGWDADAGAEGNGRRVAAGRPAKVKKVRIWDEEDA